MVKISEAWSAVTTTIPLLPLVLIFVWHVFSILVVHPVSLFLLQHDSELKWIKRKRKKVSIHFTTNYPLTLIHWFHLWEHLSLSQCVLFKGDLEEFIILTWSLSNLFFVFLSFDLCFFGLVLFKNCMHWIIPSTSSWGKTSPTYKSRCLIWLDNTWNNLKLEIHHVKSLQKIA